MAMQGVLDAEAGAADWLAPIAPQAFALVYQNLLLEERDAVLGASSRLWGALLARTPAAALAAAAPLATVQGWAALAATPPGARFDVRFMLLADGLGGQDAAAPPKNKRARLKVRLQPLAAPCAPLSRHSCCHPAVLLHQPLPKAGSGKKADASVRCLKCQYGGMLLMHGSVDVGGKAVMALPCPPDVDVGLTLRSPTHQDRNSSVRVAAVFVWRIGSAQALQGCG